MGVENVIDVCKGGRILNYDHIACVWLMACELPEPLLRSFNESAQAFIMVLTLLHKHSNAISVLSIGCQNDNDLELNVCRAKAQIAFLARWLWISFVWFKKSLLYLFGMRVSSIFAFKC